MAIIVIEKRRSRHAPRAVASLGPMRQIRGNPCKVANQSADGTQERACYEIIALDAFLRYR
jgi:hypothetical protein